MFGPLWCASFGTGGPYEHKLLCYVNLIHSKYSSTSPRWNSYSPTGYIHRSNARGTMFLKVHGIGLTGPVDRTSQRDHNIKSSRLLPELFVKNGIECLVDYKYVRWRRIFVNMYKHALIKYTRGGLEV